jgi:hypothetical protein
MAASRDLPDDAIFEAREMLYSGVSTSLRGALATKQSMLPYAALWIASAFAR